MTLFALSGIVVATSLPFLLTSSAHVHLERFVALPLKVRLHFLNCVADQRS
jgi:hypothetical protein